MNFVFDFQMLYLAIGLLGLILINVLIGSINGFLERKFDKKKFIDGLIKGSVVCVSFVGVYFIGILNPSIAIEIGDQQLTLLMAVNIVLLSGFGWYGKEVLTKLATFVNAKFNIAE